MRIVERTLDVLSRHPAVQKMINEEDERERKRRASLVERARKLREEEARTMPALEERKREATAAVEAARKALEAAKADLRRASGEAASASARFDREIAGIHRELREMAHPSIAEFIAECRRHLGEALNRFATDVRAVRMLDGSYRSEVVSNGAAIRADREKINAAIEAAEALQLAAVADVAKELAAIRATLPAWCAAKASA